MYLSGVSVCVGVMCMCTYECVCTRVFEATQPAHSQTPSVCPVDRGGALQ